MTRCRAPPVAGVDEFVCLPVHTMNQKSPDQIRIETVRSGEKRGGAGADLGAIIASVESQLTALKEAQSSHEQDLEKFEQQHAELTRREEKLASLRSDLETRESALEERCAAIEQRESELAERATELQEREQTIQRRVAELRQAREQVETERGALDEGRSKIEAADEQIRRRREEIQSEARDIAEARKTLDEQREQIDEQRESLDRRQGEIEAAAESLEADRAALAEDRNALEALQTELTERSAAIETAQREAEEKLSARAAKLQREADSLDEQRRRIEAGEDDAARAASERIDALQQELEEFRVRLEETAASLAEREQRLEALGAEAAKREEAAREEASRRIEQAEADAERRLNEAITKKDEQIAGLRVKLESLENERDEALKEAAKAPAHADTDEERINIQIAKRDKAIEALSKRLEQADQKRRELEAALQKSEVGDGPSAESAPINSAALARRKARLHQYKELLRRQSSKLMQARKALIKRQSEYERVLKRREELARAKTALDEASRRVLKSSARNKASIAVLCFTMTVALLGGLSWAVAERAFPGDAVLQATLSMVPEGAEPDARMYDAWSAHIQNLTDDPRLIEIAAGRMKRRGILELATPGDLSAHLRDHLDIAELAPGEIAVTLTGRGAKRTELALETLLASIVSVANDARDRRLDRSATAVTERPRAGDQPISRDQIMHAGMIWAGASLGALLLGLLIWARAARAGRVLDEDLVIEQTLDEERWMTAGA